MGKGGPNDWEKHRKSVHGCDVLIYLDEFGVIQHEYRGNTKMPTIRSYSDGIKVGCSFLTSEALDKLHDWHHDFLGKQNPRTWQKGADAKD